MGYVKKWIPPFVERNNLANWKEQIDDIEFNMISSGIQRVTDVEGQLDLDTVTALPAIDQYAGFRIYSINDGLHAIAPIYFRLDFGNGCQGLYSSESYLMRDVLAIRVRFFTEFQTDGTPINPIGDFRYPQAYNPGVGSNTNSRNINGMSYICKNDEFGFFGFVQGSGARVSPSNYYGNYESATLAILIQRTTDAAGYPTPEGFTVFGSSAPNFNSGGGPTDTNGYPNNAPASFVQSFVYESKVMSVKSDLMAPRLGGAVSDVVGTIVEPQYIYSKTPFIKTVDNLLTYKHTTMAPGTEFNIEMYPGQQRTMVTLGQGSGLIPDGRIGIAAHYTLAMLWQ